jgi:hypothetical protein
MQQKRRVSVFCTLAVILGKTETKFQAKSSRDFEYLGLRFSDESCSILNLR